MVKLLLCNYCGIEYLHLWNDSVGDMGSVVVMVGFTSVQNVWWKYPATFGQDCPQNGNRIIISVIRYV